MLAEAEAGLLEALELDGYHHRSRLLLAALTCCHAPPRPSEARKHCEALLPARACTIVRE